MVPRIMGIVNVTPDSFSDGGHYVAVDEAVRHAMSMADAGATIIDVGGESTRPGATAVPVDDELARVLPVVEAVVRALDEHPGGRRVDVSVDTRRAEVARAAVAAGASIINDVSAELWPIAADTGAGWIAMHMPGDPTTMQGRAVYDDVVEDVLATLLERADAARNAGVADVWIDPGFGFGKNASQNLRLVGAIDRFVDSAFPVVLGVSRKRTMGLVSTLADTVAGAQSGTVSSTSAPPDSVLAEWVAGLEDRQPSATEDRLEASLACAAWATRAGVSVLRVHDVAPHVALVDELSRHRWPSVA